MKHKVGDIVMIREWDDTGYMDEDHLLAAFWNLGWAVNQRTTHPELIDVPWKDDNK